MEIKTYEDVRASNLVEKAALLQGLGLGRMSQLDEEEMEGSAQQPEVVPAASRPSRKRKRKPASPAEVASPRKSRRLEERPGPAPSYHEEVEEARGRSRTVGSGGARARSRQLRPRRPKTYVEEELEPEDGTIFCEPCGQPRAGGCSIHPPVFAQKEDYDLVVQASYIKKAGEGVVNHGSTIPLGVLFGPYPGKFVPLKNRQKAEESGKAWELIDPEDGGLIGFVDPGSAEDSSYPNNWMAKVNCTPETAAQNLVGFQFQGKIYYRVVKPIPAGVELLVYYGDHYAKDLGIKVSQLDLFKGKEDHTTEGFPCGFCSTIYATEDLLQQHLSLNGGASTPCQASKLQKKKGRAGPAAKVCNRCGQKFGRE